MNKLVRLNVLCPSKDGRVDMHVANWMFSIQQQMSYAAVREVLWLYTAFKKVEDARNDLAKQALEQMEKFPDTEHWMLWVDDDMAPPPDAMMKLYVDMCVHPERDIESGWFSRKVDGDPGLVFSPGDYRQMIPIRDFEIGSAIEVGWTGLAFTLMRGETLRKMPQPFFRCDPDNPHGGEDRWFCQQARKVGLKMFIHTGCPVGHASHDLKKVFWPYVGAATHDYGQPSALVTHEQPKTGRWIGVDFDGTLAVDSGKRDDFAIGDPVPEMVERVKAWRAMGWEVKVLTSRATLGSSAIESVEMWCEKYIGERLPVTATKDFGMVELWDNLAVRVEHNEGRPHGRPALHVNGKPQAVKTENVDIPSAGTDYVCAFLNCDNPVLAQSMLDQLKGSPKIVCLDNGRYLHEWAVEHVKDLSVIPTEKNLGWGGGVNRLMDHITLAFPEVKAVWVLNDDLTEVTAEKAQQLFDELMSLPNAAVVSPSITMDSPTSHKVMISRPEGGIRARTYVDFYGPMISTKAWKDVGPLDIEAIGRGHGLDIDWTYRAKAKGYTMYVDDAVVIKHEHPGTTTMALGEQNTHAYTGWQDVIIKRYGNTWETLCLT